MMSKTYEIKTSKDGQQDFFKVRGDHMEYDKEQIGIYKMVEEDAVLVAAFQFWVYGITLPLDEEKPPEI
jgi:hypothetical protein